jgi:hypothetical protein
MRFDFVTSPLVGKHLDEISKVAIVIGVVRGGVFLPDNYDPTFRTQLDDTLLVLGDPMKNIKLENEAGYTL